MILSCELISWPIFLSTRLCNANKKWSKEERQWQALGIEIDSFTQFRMLDFLASRLRYFLVMGDGWKDGTNGEVIKRLMKANEQR